MSCSTANETPAIEVGKPEGDATLDVVLERVVLLEELVPLDEIVALELLRVDVELTVLDELETIEELEELEEVADVELVTELTTFWYMFSPEGPPQIWVELPAQSILQRPSETG